MKKVVGRYVIVFILAAFLLVGVYYMGSKLTGFAVIGNYTNESGCVAHGYIWENFTNQSCNDVISCTNTTVNCEPCLTYEDINGTQGACLNWTSCINQNCTTSQNCTSVVTGGQCTGNVCDSSHLSLCLTSGGCGAVGGYWYNSTCNAQAECVPKTCGFLNYSCGSIGNGCGGTLACGNCSSGYTCNSGTCKSSAVAPVVETPVVTPTEIPVATTKLSSTDIPASSIYSGSSKTIKWTITNAGTLPLYSCNLKFTGDYASWVSYSGNNADIILGGQKEFAFDVSVPRGTNEGSHSLTVSVECAQVSESKAVVINVLNEKLALDILNTKRTTKGRVRVDYSLEELSGGNQSVEIFFSLLNSGGQEVSNASTNKSIDANATEEFKIYIPINKSLEGNLTLSTKFNSEIYSNSVQEPIVLGAPVGGFAIFEGIGAGSIVVLVVVVFALIAILIVVRRMMRGKSNKKIN